MSKPEVTVESDTPIMKLFRRRLSGLRERLDDAECHGMWKDCVELDAKIQILETMWLDIVRL